MKVCRAFVLIAVAAFASLTSAQLPPFHAGEVMVTAYQLSACIAADSPKPYRFSFYNPDGAPVTDGPPFGWQADPRGLTVTSYSPVLREFVVLQPTELQRVTSGRTFETLTTFSRFGPLAMSTNVHGEIYVVGAFQGDVVLRKFSAAGSLLQSSQLLLPLDGFTGGLSMDLAQDGCTAILASGHRIARHNVCTNTPLPDFAPSLPSSVTEARYLPNGNVLVATQRAVVQLDQTGTAVRTYQMPLDALPNLKFAFDPAGTSVWITRSAGCGGGPIQLLRLGLATGNVISTTSLEQSENIATSVSVLGEWRAAIAGAQAAAAVPLFSNVMLGAVAAIIAAIAITRLRL